MRAKSASNSEVKLKQEALFNSNSNKIDSAVLNSSEQDAKTIQDVKSLNDPPIASKKAEERKHAVKSTSSVASARMASSRKIGYQSSNLTEDEEFNRLVRMGLGQTSMHMRKDRRGIAIQKGKKLHKLSFRDEISFQVSEKEPFAPRTNPLSAILTPKVLPGDGLMSNNRKIITVNY